MKDAKELKTLPFIKTTRTFFEEAAAYERRWKIAFAVNSLLFLAIQANFLFYIFTPDHKSWALTAAKWGTVALIVFSLWMFKIRRQARRLKQDVHNVQAYNPELRSVVESIKRWK